MKSPLRHSRYAGDDQTTLEELLTEYMERTNILYYELLSYPITEIEAKKELLVHLSIYDACFATEEAASPSPVSPQRHIEVLVKPTHTVRDLLKLIRKGCRLPEDTPLRACETVQHGTMITRLIQEDVPLQSYWGQGAVSDPHSPEILVEQIPMYEINSDNGMVDKQASAMSEHRVFGVASTEVVTVKGDISLEKTEAAHVRSPRQLKDVSPDDDEAPMWYYKGVVHFNFQNTSQKLIHPHGVPCVVRFSERDTVGAIKERIRQRLCTVEFCARQGPESVNAAECVRRNGARGARRIPHVAAHRALRSRLRTFRQLRAGACGPDAGASPPQHQETGNWYSHSSELSRAESSDKQDTI
uniref:ubiquitinyl hydrolase 1 n=1 Tax=Hyaloperonospora arabidopsidis (strain Emoy2) TaxID=559515 RepID=M4B5H8_HYAAE